MALNELIAQGAQFKAPDLLGQYSNALAIQSGIQKNQMNQLDMAEKQRSFAEQEGLRNYLRTNPNLDSPEGMQGLNQYGAAGQTLLTARVKQKHEAASAQKSTAEAGKVEYETARAKLTDSLKDAAGLTTPGEAIAHISGAARDGKIPMDKAEQLLASIPQDIGKFGEWRNKMMFNLLSAQNQLEQTFHTLDNGQQITQYTTSKYMPGAAPTVVAQQQKMQTPDSIASNATQQWGQNLVDARARDRLAQETASGHYTPETVDFLAQTYITTGQLPPMGMGKAAAEARAKVLDRAQQLATGKVSPDAVPTATPSEAASNIAQNKQNIAGQTATVKDFSSGLSSRRVTALNTALNHLGTMESLSKDLANTDVRVFNAAANTLAKQLGVAAPTSFDAARALVANEVIKAVVANGGSMAERKEAAETFARASSPEQLAGVTKTYKELLAGQLTSLAQQYETGTGRKDFNAKLSPTAAKLVSPAPATPTNGWGKVEVVK